jgi:hypothetical protein
MNDFMFDGFSFFLLLGTPFENTVEVIECHSAVKSAA